MLTIGLNRAVALLAEPTSGAAARPQLLRELGAASRRRRGRRSIAAATAPMSAMTASSPSLPRGADPESFSLDEALPLLAARRAARKGRERPQARQSAPRQSAAKPAATAERATAAAKTPARPARKATAKAAAKRRDAGAKKAAGDKPGAAAPPRSRARARSRARWRARAGRAWDRQVRRSKASARPSCPRGRARRLHPREPIRRSASARSPAPSRVAPGDRPALRDMLRADRALGAVTRAANRRLVAGAAAARGDRRRARRQRRGRRPAGPPGRLAGTGAGADLAPRSRPGPSEPTVGERAAARLVPLETGEIEARIIRRLDSAGERVVGVFQQAREGGRVMPADRRNRNRISRRGSATAGGAADGELVVAEELPAAPARLAAGAHRRAAGPAVAIPARSACLAIAAFDIPTEFPAAALAEAEAALPVEPGRPRRSARDRRWSRSTAATPAISTTRCGPSRIPTRPIAGGWHLVVAIADVAWYVRPGSALDREAERRGNSVYFPDRVVPMLPEALSNELCSLKPGGRPRLPRRRICGSTPPAASGGTVSSAAIMRSAARLTYEEVQAARDGTPSCAAAAEQRSPRSTAPSRRSTEARAARGALELDLGEDRVVLDAERRPVGDRAAPSGSTAIG